MTNKVILCVGLFSFGGMFVFLGAALHLSYTKMDLMLSHLKSCRTITTQSCLIHAGPQGRLYVLGVIMALMITPSIYIRNGGANAKELTSFPVHLKRKLILLHWIAWVSLLTLFGMVTVVKLGLL